MPTQLRDMLEALKPDSWRQQNGFSPDIIEAQAELFDSSKDPCATFSRWLGKCQPCLFGRVAAKFDLIRYCVLREGDLTTDEAVRDSIQDARQRWARDAFDGKASAFIVLLISPRIANAIPDDNVAAIAHRLCSLYLRDVDVEPDTVHQERIWLEKPGPDRMTWEWLAGVNYFCAQGDRRWWHDHRIPAGMGFSVNSVGHMAKAGKVSELMNRLNDELKVADREFSKGTIRSLEEALKFAMLTIDNAAETISGKATNLIPLHEDEESAALPT